MTPRRVLVAALPHAPDPVGAWIKLDRLTRRVVGRRLELGATPETDEVLDKLMVPWEPVLRVAIDPRKGGLRMGVKVRERNGAWWLFIDHQGRRKAKRVGVAKTGKKAAEQTAIRLPARLAEGGSLVAADGAAPTPTFREYAGRWLRSETAIRLKPITAERYGSTLNRHLYPAFGETRLPELTRAAIKARLVT